MRCLPWLDDGPLAVAPGMQRGELQVIAAVQRQLDDGAVFDHRADRDVRGLQQRRAAGDLTISASAPTSIVTAMR